MTGPEWVDIFVDILPSAVLFVFVVAAFLIGWQLLPAFKKVWNNSLDRDGARISKVNIAKDGFSLELLREVDKVKSQQKKTDERLDKTIKDVITHVVDLLAHGPFNGNINSQTSNVSVKSFAADLASSSNNDLDNTFAGKEFRVIEPPERKLRVLWANDDQDLLPADILILKAMNILVHEVDNNDDALDYLRAGNQADLVICDMDRTKSRPDQIHLKTRPNEGDEAGLALFKRLIDGHGEIPWQNESGENRIGEKMRFAVYTWQDTVSSTRPKFWDVAKTYAEQKGNSAEEAAAILKEVTENTLLTWEFKHLKSRVEWLQRELSRDKGRD